MTVPSFPAYALATVPTDLSAELVVALRAEHQITHPAPVLLGFVESLRACSRRQGTVTGVQRVWCPVCVAWHGHGVDLNDLTTFSTRGAACWATAARGSHVLLFTSAVPFELVEGSVTQASSAQRQVLQGSPRVTPSILALREQSPRADVTSPLIAEAWAEWARLRAVSEEGVPRAC